MYTNDSGKPGDKLILTKALGVGLICNGKPCGRSGTGRYGRCHCVHDNAEQKRCRDQPKYTVHAATDVTGFSFLGHLHEMMGGKLSCIIDARMVPVLPGAEKAADDFLYTAAGQRNRNHTGPYVTFENVPFAMEEVLFDPQTFRRTIAGRVARRSKCAGSRAAGRWPAPQRSWVRSYPKPNRKLL